MVGGREGGAVKWGRVWLFGKAERQPVPAPVSTFVVT